MIEEVYVVINRKAKTSWVTRKLSTALNIAVFELKLCDKSECRVSTKESIGSWKVVSEDKSIVISISKRILW